MLSYDIIYRIYFFTNDYSTANNFWIVSKQFTKHYMTRYNKSYIHKYKILYNNFFGYLQFLSLQKIDVTTCLFYEYFSLNSNLDTLNNLILLNDTFFIYNLYKKFLSKFLPNKSYDFLNKILCKGPNYLDKIFTVKFNKNKIFMELTYFIPLIDLLDT